MEEVDQFAKSLLTRAAARENLLQKKDENNKMILGEVNPSASPHSRKTRLNCLAKEINSWEEEEKKVKGPSPVKQNTVPPVQKKLMPVVGPKREVLPSRTVVGPPVTLIKAQGSFTSSQSTSTTTKRKSTTTDPSELSVAQKARLFDSPNIVRKSPKKVLEIVGKKDEKKVLEIKKFESKVEEKIATFHFGELPDVLIGDLPKDSFPKEEPKFTSSPKDVSPKKIADSVRLIRKSVSQKELYPSLTDIDCSSSSSEEEEVVSTTLAIQQIDACIDEALEGQSFDDESYDSADISQVLNSTALPATPPAPAAAPLAPLPISAPLQTAPPAPQKLTHTVSVYRKQTESAQIKPPEEEDAAASGSPMKSATPNKKTLDELQQQILIQQKSIAQASKAIDLCINTGFNNNEWLEAERVLLVAVHRRKQLLQFVEKEKEEKSDLRAAPCALSTLTIGKIKLSLKRSRPGQTIFVALLKHNENVFATKLFNNDVALDQFLFKNVKPDFSVVLEIYLLEQFGSGHKDTLPATPTAKTKFTKMFSTPTKTSTSKHFLPSVRTPSFKLQGTLNLNISNIKNRNFNLILCHSNVLLPPVTMEIECQCENLVQFEGFLTIFRDVSGLGAWHRRYAKMEGFFVNFWAYPEDCGVKPPLSTINLKHCITPRVAPAPREVCARQNTFLLVTSRKTEAEDRNGLVLSVQRDYTAIKHLMSADGRKERDEWIAKLNSALVNLRAWFE